MYNKHEYVGPVKPTVPVANRDTDAEAAAMGQPASEPVPPKPSRDVGTLPQKLTTGNVQSDKVTGRGGNGQDEKIHLTDFINQPAAFAVRDVRKAVQDKELAEELSPPDDAPRGTIIEENISLIVQARKKPGTYSYIILTGYTEVDLSDAVNLFISMNPPYWKCAGGPTVTPTGLFAQAMAQAAIRV